MNNVKSERRILLTNCIVRKHVASRKRKRYEGKCLAEGGKVESKRTIVFFSFRIWIMQDLLQAGTA